MIQVYELWESEEALQAHFDHPNYHDMRAMLGAGGLVERGEPQAPHRQVGARVRRRLRRHRFLRLTVATPRIDAVVFDFGGVLITSICNQVGNVAASHGVDST